MILLDTCTLLWLASSHEHLSERAKKHIKDNADSLYVSAISAFEVAVKVEKKLLTLPMKANAWYEEALSWHGITELPVTGSIAFCAASLPALHKDPADRMIIATSLEHHLKIITPDRHIIEYPGVKCIW